MSGALSGLRVIDFGQYVAGPLLARMLADQGADVVRVDPPGGPRWQHPSNAVLQRGKRSIVLDIKNARDHHIAKRLIGSADVVIENFRPGVLDRVDLSPAAMTAADPRLIYCSLPGFASDDPRAQTFAHEGLISAAAGMYGSRDGDPASAPVFNTLPLSSCFAALIGANSVVAALIARERSGLGQRIEVSLFDASFELTRYYGDRLPDAHGPRIRLGASTTMALTHHYACKDGRFVHLSWLEGRQLAAFAQIAGTADTWGPEGLLDHTRVRGDRAFSEQLRSRLAEVFKTRTAAEWMAAANPEADLAECLTTEEWLLYSEQARASGAVLTLPDPEVGLTYQAGYPIAMSLTPPATPGPRRPLDADRAAVLAELEAEGVVPTAPQPRAQLNSALEGFRAIDVTQLLAAPTACRILAEYGADVVQITNPRARAGRDYHLATNSGKRSIVLDLKAPGGMDVFEALVRDANVFSANLSSEVAQRLGVDEASVRAIRPDVIYSRVSAYGHQGPWREFRGHDQVGQAITGMEVRWGRDHPTPLMQPNPLNDFGTGHLAAFGMLLGLYVRLRTGLGQHVGASLAHTATFLQTPYMLAYRGKSWDEPAGQQCRGFGPLKRLYQASDRWFFLAARNRDQLAVVDGLEELAGLSDERLEVELSARFAARPAAEWLARFARHGVAAHLMNTPEEAMRDPWALSHGVSRSVEFPLLGPGQVVGPAARLSRTPMQAPRPAAPIGWEGEEIVRELGLGYRLNELVASGAVQLREREPAAVPV